VLAAQTNLGTSQQHDILSFTPKDDLIAAQIGAAGDALFSAEPKYLRPRRRAFGACGIVGVDDDGVAFGLVLKNSRFRASVLFKRSVPVEVIGSQVQQDGNVRPK